MDDKISHLKLNLIGLREENDQLNAKAAGKRVAVADQGSMTQFDSSTLQEDPRIQQLESKISLLLEQIQKLQKSL